MGPQNNMNPPRNSSTGKKAAQYTGRPTIAANNRRSGKQPVIIQSSIRNTDTTTLAPVQDCVPVSKQTVIPQSASHIVETVATTNANSTPEILNSDLVDVNKSAQQGLYTEGGKVDEAETVAVQKSRDSLSLPVHNSFDMLHDECELPSGEVMLVNNETNPVSKVTLVDSAEIVNKVSEEIVSLSQAAHSKNFDALKNVSYESTNLITNNTSPFGAPIITPVTTNDDIFVPMQSRYPSVVARDPILSKQAASSKIATYDATVITPITTYDENLGPDKGKISQPANSKNTSKACKKSEKLLSKFWADGLDSGNASVEEKDMSDEQEQNFERDFEERSLFTPIMSRRQNKKKHANKLNDAGVRNTFSEQIQTRSKKGVIKSNPKYL